MILLQDDIIAALATPVGEGAISIIRVSGRGAIGIVNKLFQGKIILDEAKSHTIHYGNIISVDEEVIDDVLVSVFRNPNSYTGEDSVEISSHASSIVVKRIIEELVKNDVRLAEPGEFTRRAFLNGKMDLVQAEAVADIINSRTEASLRGARNQLDGILSNKIESLRNDLINTTSLIELELDFAEEDLEFVAKDKVIEQIQNIVFEIKKLLETYSFGRVMRDGVNVAIVGKPNVGKSSLLNYLLKESRAIVSEIPGTTRDVIREEVSIDGILFKLFDTAGIRLTEDVIEKEGVERSREAVKNSDVVVLIDEVVNGIPIELYNELIKIVDSDRIITALNKLDLVDESQQQENSSSNTSVKKVVEIVETTVIDKDADVKISVLNGSGIDTFLELLKEKSFGSNSFTEKSAVINNVRHFDALSRAKNDLEEGIASLHNNLSGEFISVNLRGAENALGEIIGKVTADDILNNIFHNFCIGK